MPETAKAISIKTPRADQTRVQMPPAVAPEFFATLLFCAPVTTVSRRKTPRTTHSFGGIIPLGGGLGWFFEGVPRGRGMVRPETLDLW